MEWLKNDIPFLQKKIDDFKRREKPYLEQMNRLSSIIGELEE